MSPRGEVGIGLTPAGPYDRIVVGAGTAGCVLAARLAADRGERVLVVEAGPDPGTETQVHAELYHGTVSPVGGRWDWGLDAAIVGERRGPISRGRVVGGSAQINDCGARAPASDRCRRVERGGWDGAVGLAVGLLGPPRIRRGRALWVIGVEGPSVADTSLVRVAIRAPAAFTAMMTGHHAVLSQSS